MTEIEQATDPIAVEWPEIGSKWTRITDSATADWITVKLPARVETLVVDKVIPEDPQGRQIQGQWFCDPASGRYSTSHVIFWATWERLA